MKFRRRDLDASPRKRWVAQYFNMYPRTHVHNICHSSFRTRKRLKVRRRRVVKIQIPALQITNPKPNLHQVSLSKSSSAFTHSKEFMPSQSTSPLACTMLDNAAYNKLLFALLIPHFHDGVSTLMLSFGIGYMVIFYLDDLARCVERAFMHSEEYNGIILAVATSYVYEKISRMP